VAEKIGQNLSTRPSKTTLRDEAVQVLMKLEYKKAEAQKRVESVLANCHTVDEVVREALSDYKK